jgi:hypothetical protein
MSPFTVISTPSNTGSIYEAFDGGKAHRGYEVDERIRDEVTLPLQALQARRARGSPAEDEGGFLGGGPPPSSGPARRGPGRQGPVALADEPDEFETPQGAESSFYYAPDRSERLSREEATYPLFRFRGHEGLDICGGIISSQGGGPSKFCIDRNCPFAHINKARASLMPRGSYVQFSDKHALFDPMLPLEAAGHDSGSAGVLTESFTQEVWVSVFRQLVDNWKDGTLGGQELVYVAATPGRTAQTVTLSHCSAGDATSGVWSLAAWYPPFFEGATPLPVVAEMWFPLGCYVNDREHAFPHLGTQPVVAAMAAVVRSDGLVQLCGLFPASDRSARVLVSATSSPSGLGSRALSLPELGGLWDIPISVMDSLVGPTSGDMYRGHFDTPPTKSLLVGVDSLLTTSFRGGLQVLQDGRPRKGRKGGGILGVTSRLSK